MRLLVLVCRDRAIEFTAEDQTSIGPQVMAWVEEMEQRGIRLQGDVLGPADATVTVRVRGEDATVADGPRIETTEPISGFNLLDCADMDEAIEVSTKHPIARFGTIELRPIVQSRPAGGARADQPTARAAAGRPADLVGPTKPRRFGGAPLSWPVVRVVSRRGPPAAGVPAPHPPVPRPLNGSSVVTPPGSARTAARNEDQALPAGWPVSWA